MPDTVAGGINLLLDHYLAIGDQLADDTLENVAAHARKIADVLDELIILEITSTPHFWHHHQDKIAAARSNALKMVDITKLDDARLRFADVSIAIEQLLMATGVPPGFDQEVQTLHCPMYREGQGGTTWLQAAGKVRNPYFGPKMLECFDRKRALPVTGHQHEE